MLLVDALFVNYGGAFGLLQYLVSSLEEKGVDFFLLADSRCNNKFDNVTHVQYLDATLSNRKEFYRHHLTSFSSVFCFGNVPPPVKLSAPVYTYFHNINLLTLRVKSRKRRFMNFVKREYIRWNKGNTTLWMVQTNNVRNTIKRYLGVKDDDILVLPFYSIPSNLDGNSDKHNHEYVFVGEYTDEKGHIPLLKAWRILYRNGHYLKLHLTISSGPKDFMTLYNDIIDEGVLIENHGFVSRDEVFKLLLSCKATIYPSFNESLGLGLIEAIEAGCDVLVSDLPFAYCICKPSATFNPYDPQSIANAVLCYEEGRGNQTQLIIKDSINELINTIIQQ